ncbi:hypothetical protein MNBD_UNCLBAC01-710 [hydrothermal vent metagenome]|uniref:Nucleoside phosphorylase domain-containing protein n=1 Tax=hydrothermal vent metagenome TaxID=652676 RepID=A0A3B1CYS6_9ZZZZ
MNVFEKLFGIDPQKIKKTCILTPFLTKNLLQQFDIKKLEKGFLYKCANTKNFTLIHTGIGTPFVGDAVLYLKDTDCQNIFFFGSCGLIESSDNLNIGSLVTPSSSLAIEGFTQVLNQEFDSINVTFPHKKLLEKFNKNHSKKTHNVICASFGSLKLEEENLNFLKKNNVQALDMETSSFFHAATKIKRRALALLYVTDIIKEKPFYRQYTSEDKIAVESAINQSVEILKRACGTSLLTQ